MTGMDIIANMNGKLRTFEAINGRKPSEEERKEICRKVHLEYKLSRTMNRYNLEGTMSVEEIRDKMELDEKEHEMQVIREREEEYRRMHGIPEDSRIRRDGRFLKEKSLTEEKLAAIGDLHELAQKRGQTLAEMALAWDLTDGAITSTIIGASRPEQILDNIKALENTSFTKEELERIDEISFRPGVQGLVR